MRHGPLGHGAVQVSVDDEVGLRGADEVILLDIYPAREDPIDGVSSDLIADPLRTLMGESVVHRAGSFDAARDEVLAVARAGDVVMTIGAGDVTALAPRIAAGLDASPGAVDPQGAHNDADRNDAVRRSEGER